MYIYIHILYIYCIYIILILYIMYIYIMYKTGQRASAHVKKPVKGPEPVFLFKVCSSQEGWKEGRKVEEGRG